MPTESSSAAAEGLAGNKKSAELVLGLNMGAESTYKIDPLTDDNWVVWCSCMTTMLKFHHAYSHIKGTVPKPDNPVTSYMLRLI